MSKSRQVTYLKEYQPPHYLIDKIDLEFDLGEQETLVTSHLTMSVNPNASSSPDLILNGQSLELISLLLNNQLLTKKEYKLSDHSLTIFRVPEKFTLTIQTKIKPQDNKTLNGLYKSRNIFCTQCEPEGFRWITYYLDCPDVMSKFTTKIIADKKRYPILLSNGNLIAKGELAGGKHWVTWEDPFKKPSYLFALVAGDLDCLEDCYKTKSGRRITLKIYAEKGNLERTYHAMAALKKAMAWDEKEYGREYDLDNYLIVAVNDFNAGAMENKGLNIFNDKYILANPATATDDDYVSIESVIAHEYFHNWTGNRITCRDWFQLCLKEGLTIFRDQSFSEDTIDKTVVRIRNVNDLRIRQFAEDAGTFAHSVCPDSYMEISNFYTATIYKKGAEIFRMIQLILGKSKFKKGMDYYFKHYDGQAITVNDFVSAMEKETGANLKLFRLWYKQAGTPKLDINSHYDASKKIYKLDIKQSCPPTPGQKKKYPLHIPIKIALLDQTGKEIPFSLYKERPETEKILHIMEEEVHYSFSNIKSKPILSLLRGFSAPVKVKYDYTDEELLFLFKNDSDKFNRWEAGQKYATKILLRLINDFKNRKELKINDAYFDTLNYLLKDNSIDNYLLAEMLTVPTGKYLAEQMPIIEVEAIYGAREFFMREIAIRMKDKLLSIYHINNRETKSKNFSMANAAKRQIKNRCLFLLMLLPDANIHTEIGMKQFQSALKENMTDTMAALYCLVNLPGELGSLAIYDFYKTWKKEPLVLDKWFSAQALSKLPDTLKKVKNLLKHEAFDIRNPNKVYSLLGTFAGQNFINFHAIDGSAYKFLSKTVHKIDSFNPQIAAQIVRPLLDWRRYDLTRQKLMKDAINLILQHEKISKGVYELASKSLV